MGPWQVVGLDPDRTDLSGLTSIQTLPFVEDSTAHSLLLYIVVVAGDEWSLRLELLLGVLRLVLLYDGLEGLGTGMLICTRGSYSVGLGIAGLVDVLAELLVVLLVAVGTLDELAHSLGELQLCSALLLDSLVGELDGLEHLALLHLLHLSLDHHDVV